MRYISDLRTGRVNPQHFSFDINVAEKKYDLAEFISDNAVDADDVPKLVKSVEPDSEQYRSTEDALAHYLDLAKQQAGANAPLLPDVAKTGVATGGSYPATGQLMARLQLEGDAPGDYPYRAASSPAPAPAPAAPTTALKPVPKAAQKLENSAKKLLHRKPKAAPASTPSTSDAAITPAFNPPDLPPTYTADLSDAVKNYQHRHGLTEDGKLTSETIKSLNVPLTSRVIQLQDSLERWRWLPNEYVNAPLIVNLPEFVLRGYGEGHTVDFTMKVVVGKVVGEHDTPVFAHMMKYLIFRPYWNVPVDIAKKELVPHMLARRAPATSARRTSRSPTARATSSRLHGRPGRPRRRPRPREARPQELPRPGQVHVPQPVRHLPPLHPRARALQPHPPRLLPRLRPRAEARRPRRLGPEPQQHPARRLGSPDRSTEAMNNGPDNHQVNLKNEIPIVIFYLTAIASEDGHTHFFDDLYGYDQKLQEVLSKGPAVPHQARPHDSQGQARRHGVNEVLYTSPGRGHTAHEGLHALHRFRRNPWQSTSISS